jgi:DNA-binding MarR family transcriptional regulator
MSGAAEFLTPFREIQIKFSRYYTRILGRAHLTLPQYSVLALMSVTGALTMTEVSKRLHITKPAVTYLVDHLEKGKMLKRLSDPSDRRITRLEITPKGMKTVQNIQSRIFKIMLNALDEFDESEKELVRRFYQSMAHHLGRALETEK